MKSPSFPLGVIEGFYGKSWSWAERKDTAAFLKQIGYSFYIYAPKSDPYWRRQWREPLPQEQSVQLQELASHYHSQDLKFGMGLTPYEIHFSLNEHAWSQLLDRIHVLNQIGVDILAILFDDMRGDIPQLAQIQCDILHRIREKSHAAQLIFCPTYYSTDPTLDRLFGARPPDYLRELGKKLDRSIDIFWTGEQICSSDYTESHLNWVAHQLDRKPFLWDNYPVNDGPKMCSFLHLRPASGREESLIPYLSGHAVNPMNQAYLSRIPLMTLYESSISFFSAASHVGSPQFAKRLEQDLSLFQDQGLTTLDPETKKNLLDTYKAFDSPAAREICDWLENVYAVTAFNP